MEPSLFPVLIIAALNRTLETPQTHGKEKKMKKYSNEIGEGPPNSKKSQMKLLIFFIVMLGVMGNSRSHMTCFLRCHLIKN